MKLFRLVSVFTAALIIPCILLASPAAKEKDSASKSVDSGSFGIFMNGIRVGTETFTITQTQNGSSIQSEFKAEGSAGQAAQSSELQLLANGDIRRYEWKEISPGKAQSAIVPNDQFLMQRWSSGPQEKQQEQPYLLSASTNILDDYFFVHREVLAWKYLASICSQKDGQLACTGKQTAKFGTLNPHQRSSAPASMEYIGREKASVKGVEKELNKLELKSETGTWTLWLDDQFKVLRISIPAEKTDVTRD